MKGGVMIDPTIIHLGYTIIVLAVFSGFLVELCRHLGRWIFKGALPQGRPAIITIALGCAYLALAFAAPMLPAVHS
jgi:hypothetical protein